MRVIFSKTIKCPRYQPIMARHYIHAATLKNIENFAPRQDSKSNKIDGYMGNEINKHN